MKFTTVLQGPDSIAGAQALREDRQSKSLWPFPWCFPPPGASRVTAGASSAGTILVPAVSATPTVGLAYTVDEGYQFALEALVMIYLNAGQPGVANPGDFTWSLDLNLPVGITSFQGSPIQGFTNVDVPLGSLQIPWPLECADIFNPNDTIRSKFLNVNLAVGLPNYFKTILLGWKWPAQ